MSVPTALPGRLLSLAGGMILDVPYPAAFQVAAEAGYGAVGLRIHRPGPSPSEISAIRRRRDDLGVTLLDVEYVRLTPDGRHDDWNRQLVDVAGELGARHLLCVSLDDDADRTTAGMVALAERASGAHLVPVLEFMRFTSVRSFAAARRIIERTGRDDLGVLVDALHLARCGESPGDVADVNSRLVPYAQICDAPMTPPADTDVALGIEARTDRLLPGDGALPLVPLVQALPPELPLSIEILSDRLMAELTPLERANAAMIATRAVLASV